MTRRLPDWASPGTPGLLEAIFCLGNWLAEWQGVEGEARLSAATQDNADWGKEIPVALEGLAALALTLDPEDPEEAVGYATILRAVAERIYCLGQGRGVKSRSFQFILEEMTRMEDEPSSCLSKV